VVLRDQLDTLLEILQHQTLEVLVQLQLVVLAAVAEFPQLTLELLEELAVLAEVLVLEGLPEVGVIRLLVVVVALLQTI
jgi:hypothetical protein